MPDTTDQGQSQGEDGNNESRQKWATAADTYAKFAEQFTIRAGEELIEATDAIQAYSLASSSVLDVGCGTGSVTSALRTHTPSTPILAVDISSKMVEFLSKKALPNVRIQVADALDLTASLGPADGASESYSHVLSTFMIQFTSDAHLAVREMHRVLRPQGLLGLATWGEHGLYRLIERVARTLDSGWTLPQPYSMQWPIKEHEITTALEGMGFGKVKVWKIKIEFVVQGEGGMIQYAFSGKNPANENILRAWRDNGRFLELRDAVMKTVKDEGIQFLPSEALLAVGQKL